MVDNCPWGLLATWVSERKPSGHKMRRLAVGSLLACVAVVRREGTQVWCWQHLPWNLARQQKVHVCSQQAGTAERRELGARV